MAERSIPWPVTASWQQRVRRRLSKEELDIGQADLARAVGTSEATISRLLSPHQGAIFNSKWVIPVSEYLGIDPPLVERSDPRVAALIENFLALDPQDQEAVFALAQRLRQLAPKP